VANFGQLKNYRNKKTTALALKKVVFYVNPADFQIIDYQYFK